MFPRRFLCILFIIISVSWVSASFFSKPGDNQEAKKTVKSEPLQNTNADDVENASQPQETEVNEANETQIISIKTKDSLATIVRDALFRNGEKVGGSEIHLTDPDAFDAISSAVDKFLESRISEIARVQCNRKDVMEKMQEKNELENICLDAQTKQLLKNILRQATCQQCGQRRDMDVNKCRQKCQPETDDVSSGATCEPKSTTAQNSKYANTRQKTEYPSTDENMKLLRQALQLIESKIEKPTEQQPSTESDEEKLLKQLVESKLKIKNSKQDLLEQLVSALEETQQQQPETIQPLKPTLDEQEAWQAISNALVKLSVAKQEKQFDAAPTDTYNSPSDDSEPFWKKIHEALVAMDSKLFKDSESGKVQKKHRKREKASKQKNWESKKGQKNFKKRGSKKYAK